MTNAAAPAMAGRSPPGAHAMPDPLRHLLSLHDFEAVAKKRLPKPIYAYVSGAVEDGQSERANRQAFSQYGFRPKVLVDVSKRSTRAAVLGREYAAPVGVAPMGISALSSYRGDIVLARAAADADVPCIMSGSSLIRLEEVMQAAPGTWFQAYLPGDDAQIAALIDRVAAAGVTTLVLTVDTPVAANRENNVRAGFSTPLRPSAALAWQGLTHPRWLFGTFLRTLWRHGMPHFENNYATRGAPILSANVLRDFSDRGHLNWRHVAAIRRRWQGRMVIKGILHPDDARTARAHGMDGVIVSNHGGRQLDGSLSPLQALPAIVDAAGGMDVMLDSGVRRGSDVLKAMALGARCVFVGRPFNYAATVAGQRGVAHAIGLIVEEVRRNMGLMGVVDLKALDADCVLRLPGA
ncbi:alpha-hydroxy acid oxidase [Achromobacter marplatensis]|uniref:alpha-hydroxy acid oxidase n=1 Tax=Achromobacter marplatensis TaxID=470868 RepID=UPI0039F71EC3